MKSAPVVSTKMPLTPLNVAEVSRPSVMPAVVEPANKLIAPEVRTPPGKVSFLIIVSTGM